MTFAPSHKPSVTVWATMNFGEPMVLVTASANFWLSVFGSLAGAGAWSCGSLSPAEIAENAGLTRLDLSSPINPCLADFYNYYYGSVRVCGFYVYIFRCLGRKLDEVSRNALSFANKLYIRKLQGGLSYEGWFQ